MTRSTFAIRTGCAAAAAITLVHTAAAQTAEPYPGLDAYIAKAVKTWNIPGAAVAIVRNDSVIYAKGFGTLTTGNAAPVNERTLFEIGSSSKAFTATTIAMLVTDGKMRWDAPLAEYLPDFRLYDPLASGAVTIRDALSHRSGIARGELVWVGSGIGRDEVLHRVRFLKNETPFRSQYSYQNIMFLAAGQAAGKAAGSTWDDLVRQRIFTPLAMTSTSTTSSGLNHANMAVPHGLDHDTAFVKPEFDAQNIAPAGSIVSNAVDMAQWLRFQLSDGVVNGKRLVSSAALRETHTPQMIIPPAARGPASDTAVLSHFTTYGFGWIVEDYRGQLVWQHGGNTPGMTTALGMLPEKKLGVVILSNMQSTPLPGILERYIFDRALGAPVKDLSGEAYARSLVQRRRADSVSKAMEAAHVAAGAAPLPLSAYAGTFTDSLYGKATVALKNGKLELSHGDWSGPLEYWNATNFRWTLPPGAPLTQLFIKYEVSPDNTVSGLWFGLGGDITLLNRVPVPRAGRAAGAGVP